MHTPASLRTLRPEGLADVLQLRPDVLLPTPARSLAEIAARLDQPASILRCLRHLDLAALQVAAAAAALGDGAGAVALGELLGAAGDQHRTARVGEALDQLDRYRLLEPDGQLGRAVRAVWFRPLGLDEAVADTIAELTVDRLRSALTAWGTPATGVKADLVDRLGGILCDGERVRGEVAAAPPTVGTQLNRAAVGEVRLSLHGYTEPRYRGSAARVAPLAWAVDRCLLLPVAWDSVLMMPSEVALALRGADWHAPFDPDPPLLAWVDVEAAVVEREMVATGSHALRSATAVLRVAGDQPLALNKNGTLGVRELRRIAKAAGCTPGEARLSVAVTNRTGLLGLDVGGLSPTEAYDTWSAGDPAQRLATLVIGWAGLASLIFDQPDAAWVPDDDEGVEDLRHTALVAMSALPGRAPASPTAFGEWAAWRMPLALTAASPGERGPAGGAVRDAVVTLLAEAAWLGVTAAGALSPLGLALVDGSDVVDAVGELFGRPESTARLQADLTAAVLGDPSASLAATLDAMADRESGSAATLWRFSPASVGRALSAGATAEQVLSELDGIAAGAVPQPLEYLVRDVARGHGRIRGGTAACYLRSDDTALMAEVCADRRLRALALRAIAPTVAVGAKPIADTLAMLRGAGYLPVEEAGDGGVVLVRPRARRTVTSLVTDSPAAPAAGAAPHADPLDIARSLLRLPDLPPSPLIRFGDWVIDQRSLPGAFAGDE